MFLRSLLFNIAFYANLIAWLLGSIPVLVLPRRWTWHAIRGWVASSLWLQRTIAGTTCRIRGLENLPSGGFIVASKHQSFWETFALIPLFDDPAFIAKRELMMIPFFGWFLKKIRMIPVDRGRRATALRHLARRVAEEIRQGRQIVIFPEGTRRPPGAEPAYKSGIVHLYAQTGAPVVPVALNSGLYWPRRKFLRHPGTITVEILEPIPPGLPRNAFLDTLRTRLETASDRLLIEAMSTAPAPPLAPDVAERLRIDTGPDAPGSANRR